MYVLCTTEHFPKFVGILDIAKNLRKVNVVWIFFTHILTGQNRRNPIQHISAGAKLDFKV